MNQDRVEQTTDEAKADAGTGYEAPEVEDYGEVHELTLPGKAPAGGDTFQQRGAGQLGSHPPTPPDPNG